MPNISYWHLTGVNCILFFVGMTQCFLSRSPCCAKDSCALGISLGYRSTKRSNFLSTVLLPRGLVIDHLLNWHLIWNAGVAVVDAHSKLCISWTGPPNELFAVWDVFFPLELAVNIILARFRAAAFPLGSADGWVYWCIGLRCKMVTFAQECSGLS